MNCAIHTDTPAVAFCRTCGKALCENCKRDVMGAIYCEPCLAARIQGAPAATVQPAAPASTVVPVVPVAQPPSGAPSPGIALLLGFIPGVGAMYNGQFVKAFVHVIIFVLLIVAANNVSDAFGILIAFFEFYMAFDAYKTAQAKLLGLPLPDPLGIDRIFGIQEHGPQPVRPGVVTTASAGTVPPAATAPSMSPPGDAQAVASPPPAQEGTPIGAVVLIALGVLFLLGNFGMFSMHRLWPLFLIGLGLWIAYRRTVERC